MSNQETKRLRLSDQSPLPVFKLLHKLYLPNEFDDRHLEFLHLEWLRIFYSVFLMYLTLLQCMLFSVLSLLAKPKKTKNGKNLIAFADFYEQRARNDYQIFIWDSQPEYRTVLRPNIERFDYMPEEIKVTQDGNLILLGTPEHRFLNQKEKCIKIVSLETGQQIVPDINRHGLTHII